MGGSVSRSLVPFAAAWWNPTNLTNVRRLIPDDINTITKLLRDTYNNYNLVLLDSFVGEPSQSGGYYVYRSNGSDEILAGCLISPIKMQVTDYSSKWEDWMYWGLSKILPIFRLNPDTGKIVTHAVTISMIYFKPNHELYLLRILESIQGMGNFNWCMAYFDPDCSMDVKSSKSMLIIAF